MSTNEEVEKELMEKCDRIQKARNAIVAHTGKWKKGTPETRGKIVCPICNGELRYRVSGYNGHILAKCQTPNCVEWIE